MISQLPLSLHSIWKFCIVHRTGFRCFGRFYCDGGTARLYQIAYAAAGTDRGRQRRRRTELVEQLIEYQRMKEMTPYFREHMDLGRDRITKPPEPQKRQRRWSIRRVPAELVRAAHVILERIPRRTPPPASAFRGIVGRRLFRSCTDYCHTQTAGA